MEYFVQQLVNGLTLGSIYGLIAIGYTMVYGIIGMINFAHGDIFMVGAFMALIVYPGPRDRSSPVLLRRGAARGDRRDAMLTALWSWTIEPIAYRPLRGSFRLAPLITAIGMSIVLSRTSSRWPRARATSRSRRWSPADSDHGERRRLSPPSRSSRSSSSSSRRC